MRAIGKRDFLKAGVALAAASAIPARAQTQDPLETADVGNLPSRRVKTTRLFKAPDAYPNALALAPEGLWVAQQHLTPDEAKAGGVSWPQPGKEAVWLMDWNGKLLRTGYSDASNTSGLAIGGGFLWVMSNTFDATTGIHKVDLATGRQVAHLQIPLSPRNKSAGIHGGQWHDGKLWVLNNRLHTIMCIEPESWTPLVQIPIVAPPGRARYHDFTFDEDGTILQVIANLSKGPADNQSALIRYDGVTGMPLETLEFEPGSCDPHGLENHHGQIVSCDAGYHPGWKAGASPDSGWIFRIDPV